MTIKIKSSDYLWAALAGLLTGVCALPVLINSDYKNIAVLVALPIVIAIAWIIGLWVGKVLANYWGTILQLAKFAEVGFLNTAINFGLLNLISLMTGVTSGLEAGGINIPGTILSACNSYVWNKLWVFGKIDNKNFFVDAPKFILITLISLLINSAIIAAFTSYISPQFGFSKQLWLNVGKVVATAGTFMINFLGYKFLVFVKAKN